MVIGTNVYHARGAIEAWGVIHNPVHSNEEAIQYNLNSISYIHYLKADLSVNDNKMFLEFSYKSPIGKYVLEQKAIWGDI